MIAAMLVASIVGYRISGLAFEWWAFDKMGRCVAILLAIAYVYRRFRPDPWVSFGAEGCAQLLLVLTLGTVLSFILATSGFPYSDALLYEADKWLGLDWRAYLRLINDSPFLVAVTSFAYNCMAIEAIVLILTLVVTSRLVRLQQFVIANAVGLAITLVIYTFLPAGGIFPFLEIQPSEYANLVPAMTYDQRVLFDSLRSGRHPVIYEMGGIITFPSFHAVWAVFFMWAFYPIKLLRVPAILLSLLILAATPIQGAHYFVDLIGGAIVAAVAIYVAILATKARYRGAGQVARMNGTF